MSTTKLSSPTYVKPLEQDRNDITVLTVGVSETAVSSLASALEGIEAPATVEQAATVADAQERGERGTVDCLVAGDGLGSTSGLELYGELPDDGPPLIIYTAEGSETLASTAINSGVAGYVPHENAGEHTDRLAERIETVVDESRTKAELAEATRLLLQLTEYTNDTLWMFSADWSETAIINESYETVWNRSIDDLITDSEDFLEGVHPKDRDIVESEMETLSSGETAKLEYRIEFDGKYHWLNVHAEPVFDESGTVEYVAGFTRDITELKDRELSMRALNGTSTELVEAREKDEVATIVTETVQRMIDCAFSIVRTHDPDEETLVGSAASDSTLELAEVSDVTDLQSVPDTSPLYEAYRKGHPTVLERASLDDSVYQNVDVGSVMVIPLGDNGTLEIGLTRSGGLEGFKRYLVELLGRTATAALDRVDRDQTLEAYRQQLEQSNENLQQFAYIASHDLQEPLRMVSSYVDLLDSEYGDQLDEEAEEYMEFAIDGATRMKEMIDGLLAYSRVQTQATSLEPVDATDVLETTLQELSLYLDEAEMTVEYEELPVVRADQAQLGQLFQNLLKNAAEHGDATTVEVAARESDGAVEFVIADDGSGIPADQQERIFEIFEQGGTASNGTGIGLAVCERIAARHGGGIRVDSEPGGGAAFTITLPQATDGEGA